MTKTELEQTQQIQFDETIIEAAKTNDIDQEKVDAFLKGLKQTPVSESKLPAETLYFNMKILQQEKNKMFPTVAGMLVFGKSVQSFFPNATIMAASYRGNSPTSNVIDQKEIKGTITDQIEHAVKFVQHNMKVGSTIKGTKRIEYPDYAIEGVREAITNAVAHRNYSITGSSIRLFMYDDRLEILSPGGLPNTVTLENIKIVQFARNQLLVSFLAGLGYMERRGEGVLRIIDWSIKNNAPEPRFELPAEELFKVTLFKRADFT